MDILEHSKFTANLIEFARREFLFKFCRILDRHPGLENVQTMMIFDHRDGIMTQMFFKFEDKAVWKLINNDPTALYSIIDGSCEELNEINSNLTQEQLDMQSRAMAGFREVFEESFGGDENGFQEIFRGCLSVLVRSDDWRFVPGFNLPIPHSSKVKGDSNE